MRGPAAERATSILRSLDNESSEHTAALSTKAVPLMFRRTAQILILTTCLVPGGVLAQGSGGSSGGGSAGGASTGGSSAGSAVGAASGPAAGSSTAAGSPNAGSAGAGTAGVSGIPSGPASAGGLNNSVNDPSGAGNATKLQTAPGTNALGTANSSGASSSAGARLAILPNKICHFGRKRFWGSERKISRGGGCHHGKWDEQ
jgi:hypothetical protein